MFSSIWIDDAIQVATGLCPCPGTHLCILLAWPFEVQSTGATTVNKLRESYSIRHPCPVLKEGGLIDCF
jgi:hypothetical protein